MISEDGQSPQQIRLGINFFTHGLSHLVASFFIIIIIINSFGLETEKNQVDYCAFCELYCRVTHTVAFRIHNIGSESIFQRKELDVELRFLKFEAETQKPNHDCYHRK